MHAKKRKTRERRRARKLADQAWDAVESEHLDLAEKLIRRAVVTQTDNPVLWHDLGSILELRGTELEAEESFRAAISLAPEYADAYVRLAAICVRRGRLRDAVDLQTQAVRHAPEQSAYRKRLESFQALARLSQREQARKETPIQIVNPLDAQTTGSFAARCEKFDWSGVERDLTRDGCVLLPELIDAPTCRVMREWFDNDSRFRTTVVMNRPNFGRGVYRCFRAPLPSLIDEIRQTIYRRVARTANYWQELLDTRYRFPDEWQDFQNECKAAGQSTPTPILLKYEAGGFNALHRDLRGDVFFPIQLAVVLSDRTDSPRPTSSGFHGGEFLFADSPQRKKARHHSIAAGLGDGILFCTRDRMVSIGGAFGLQSVKHGASQVTSGERFVFGMPFHEYR